MRRRSAITGGSPAGRSTRTPCRPPPLTNVVGARSTKSATAEGSGDTESDPHVDAPGVEQVADEAAHVGGLLGDDAEELAHLGRIELGRLLEQRVRRALDGDQRGAQLVAHQPQELGPQPLGLVERRQSCMVTTTERTARPSARIGVALIRVRTLRPSGDREHDLLGANRLVRAEQLRQRKLAQRHLPPVGAAEGDRLPELLERMAGRPQALDDPSRLAVERRRPAAPRVEDHDADR